MEIMVQFFLCPRSGVVNLQILVINSGSSSLKYNLFDMTQEKALFSGTIDRIGLERGTHVYRGDGGPETRKELTIHNHGESLDEMFAVLTNGPLASAAELDAVAHRVGHGGKYREAVRIDEDVLAEVRRMTPLIPLHHPAMIEEIEECRIRLPHAVHVAVFDTWFHHTIPDHAAIYGLPYRYFAEKGYRRTGFHGNSHAYVSACAAEFLSRALEELKIITCHLGNGASLCAVDRGKSVDTTLGMTAVEGLMMGTRSGDVDPGLIPVIMKEDDLTPDRFIEMLYRESGLKGISGVSSDMREVEASAAKGDHRAILAIEAFCYRVKRGVGAMLMVLGRCDALVFTGGIGRNSASVRTRCLSGTEELGFVLDEAKNRSRELAATEAVVVDVSAATSRTKILLVETFEELMMARQCAAVLNGR